MTRNCHLEGKNNARLLSVISRGHQTGKSRQHKSSRQQQQGASITQKERSVSALNLPSFVSCFLPPMIRVFVTNSRTEPAPFYVGGARGSWLGFLQFPWILGTPLVHLAIGGPNDWQQIQERVG